eukprot:TRINITY_DN20391_c0_g1_i1.p2 TRINITY_DN20391_c0_g1~~TRINITY_DN20391_c0_g1_i1.p2  ORF type:complete len:103 (+),score=46.31 TRINITY_DN20391_c0_g1_i1:68-376(+)
MFASGKLTKETAEQLAKRQFYAGFFGLPWLWMSNYFYFWDIRKKNEVINRYCVLSLRCFVVACVLMMIYWMVMYFGLPDSSLWVIKPGKDVYQEGTFTKSIL